MDVNVLITIAAIIGGLAQVVFLYNFFGSMVNGEKAEQNPWEANTLEWTAPVEHVHGNWPGEIPTVYRWPYDYSKPGYDTDFIPQNVPDEGSLEEQAYSPSPVISERKTPDDKEVVLFSALLKKWLGLNRA
jgi:cytochrome c oxidase subunit 1